MNRLAIRGDLLDVPARPGLQTVDDPAVRFDPDHWLLIEDGRIVGRQAQTPGPDWRRLDHRGRLILPGFVDAHVHSAQLDVIGSWGAQLLEWLDQHTFPAELRMADPAHARAQSTLFADALLAVGTTAACVFPAVFPVSVDALFEAAQQRGMAIVAGKVMMDRLAPTALCDTEGQGGREVEALIARWHGRGRCRYAITPRFALSSSEPQLALAGRLRAGRPELVLQTHLAENRDELAEVRARFPDDRSYLEVYRRHGLVGPRSLFAHGIWLDETDRRLLQAAGSTLVFCPSSNLALGSGLFAWHEAEAAGVAVALGSDVGGGTSLSMRRTMGDAVKVLALQGRRASAWALLHAATRAPADALGLAGEIGSLEAGTMADLGIWDWASNPLARRRQAAARSLHERVFAWITLADEADLVSTLVAGVPRHERAGLS